MYHCCYPNCTYSTTERSLIEWHHIVPKELNGSDKAYNRIYLCPIHHKMVYVPESMTGQHAKKLAESIIIKGKFKSTCGEVLQIIDTDGCEKFIDIGF